MNLSPHALLVSPLLPQPSQGLVAETYPSLPLQLLKPGTPAISLTPHTTLPGLITNPLAPPSDTQVRPTPLTTAEHLPLSA